MYSYVIYVGMCMRIRPVLACKIHGVNYRDNTIYPQKERRDIIYYEISTGDCQAKSQIDPMWVSTGGSRHLHDPSFH